MNKPKISAIVAIVALAGSCFAPIGDKPEGAQFHPELSQEEISKYQGSETAAPTPSGGGSSGSAFSTPDYYNDTHASSALAHASQQNANAAESLKIAAKDAKEAEKPKPNFLLGSLLLVIGLICAYGVRIYLTKAIPDGPQ